jgi:hypothetical protein
MYSEDGNWTLFSEGTESYSEGTESYSKKSKISCLKRRLQTRFEFSN